MSNRYFNAAGMTLLQTWAKNTQGNGFAPVNYLDEATVHTSTMQPPRFPTHIKKVGAALIW